jgi:predicted GNAT superfamily acetyltransferase
MQTSTRSSPFFEDDAVIRDLVPTDLDRVLEINQANTPEVGSVDADRLAFLVDQCAIALAAVVDELLVGFVLALAPGSAYDSVNYRWFMDRDGDTMYLDRVAIEQAHRGQGLGTGLYDAVFEEIGRSHSRLRRLGLEVNIDPPNPGSLAFHHRYGFIEVGTQRTPYGAEVSLMTKDVPVH